MDYCVPVYSSPTPGVVETKFFCDWNLQIYTDPVQCFTECSSLLISKSDAYFIVLLVFSLFVLGLILLLAKAVVD